MSWASCGFLVGAWLVFVHSWYSVPILCWTLPAIQWPFSLEKVFRTGNAKISVRDGFGGLFQVTFQVCDGAGFAG